MWQQEGNSFPVAMPRTMPTWINARLGPWSRVWLFQEGQSMENRNACYILSYLSGPLVPFWGVWGPGWTASWESPEITLLGLLGPTFPFQLKAMAASIPPDRPQ